MISIDYVASYKNDASLGNRLFQYSLGRILAVQYNRRLNCDGIDGFPLTHQRLDGATYHGTHYLGGQLLHRDSLDHNKNWLLDGYFQRYEYYKDHKNDIKQWLHNEGLDRPKNTEDLVIHYRLGSYRQPHHDSVINPNFCIQVLKSESFKQLYIVTDEPNAVPAALYTFDPIIVNNSALEDFFFIESFDKIFIFFHIWKNAGTSITELISPYVSPKYRKLDYHLTALTVMSKIDREIFDSYYKFAVVRNPWDWQVSLFSYIQQDDSHPQHRLLKDMSFDEYIEWRCRPVEVMSREWPMETIFQYEFVTDHSMNFLVDKIIRYENLQPELDEVFTKLGLSVSTLPYLNRSKHKHYTEYYSDKNRDMIGDYFSKDIELFKYKFGDKSND